MMYRRSKLKLMDTNAFSCFIFYALTLMIGTIRLVEAQKKPNIVFVVADDYGFHDIGYHGSEIFTPNLDKLAAEGVKLENYYVQPICSPTRSQLMTGRYQIHTGLQHNIIWPSQPYGMPLEYPTVANLLKENGYTTHAVGKWHLGLYKKEYTPLNRGFDTFYGYWEGGEDYYTYYNCDYWHNRTIDLDLDITKAYTEEDIKKKFHTPSDQWCGYDLRDMDKPVTDMNGSYSTNVYTSKAINIIKQAQPDKPFFLYLAYQAVHSPMEVPDVYLKPYQHIQNKYRRIYAGMTSCMDEGVGNVTEALKATGLWDNTVFIFTSDNGGEILAGGNNWPLRGYKHTLWEGGVRAIGFVTGPLVKQKGAVSEELMHVSDWFPTIAAIVGTQVNSSLKLDGSNQWPMISLGKKSSRKEILHNIDIFTPLNGNRLYNNTFDTRIRAAIRMGNYKLITGMPGDGNWYPPPTNQDDLNRTQAYSQGASNKNIWLFNVRKDPSEVIDLSDVLPDQVKLMLDRLLFYNSTTVPPIYPESDPNCDPKFHGGFWGPWQ